MPDTVFLDQMTEGLPGNVDIHLSMNGKDIKMECVGKDNNGEQIFNFVDYLQKNTVKNESVVIDKQLQGHGIGKTIKANSYAVYQKAGYKGATGWSVSGYDKEADMNFIGGYVWAKFGKIPTQSAWDEIRDNMADKLHQTVQLIRQKEPQLMPDNATINGVNALLQSKNPNSIIPLAYMTAEIPDPENKGQPVKVGKFLLRSEDWDNVIDFNNKTQMQVMHTYTGGDKLPALEAKLSGQSVTQNKTTPNKTTKATQNPVSQKKKRFGFGFG